MVPYPSPELLELLLVLHRILVSLYPRRILGWGQHEQDHK